MKHFSNFGPIFGEDIVIVDNCNESDQNYSDFGQSFELPPGVKYDKDMFVPLLSGTFKFRVEEIEVFKI